MATACYCVTRFASPINTASSFSEQFEQTIIPTLSFYSFLPCYDSAFLYFGIAAKIVNFWLGELLHGCTIKFDAPSVVRQPCEDLCTNSFT